MENLDLHLNDTYLEEMINDHHDISDEDMDYIDNILSYRNMVVPFSLEIKDRKYAKMFKKTCSLPSDVLYNEDIVNIKNIDFTMTIDDENSFKFLVVLTRANQRIEEMPKVDAVGVMNLKEIYNNYLEDSDYMGILIVGPEMPYPVSIFRIESILGINKQYN